MASKKKPAPKKPARPAKKAAARKPAPKKAAVKPAKKAAAKPAARKAVPQKAAAKPVKKAAPKPAAKPARPAAKQEKKPAPAKTGTRTTARSSGVDPKSLVSIKPKVKPIIKKEPPKPAKIVIPRTSAKSSVKYEPEFTRSVLDVSQKLPTGPTMRYSDADLAEFREIIQRKLDAAKKELAYLQGLITRKDEGGDMDEARYMTMEDGSVSMEREQLSQMASRQITFIDHLEKAMMRIENKTYGICRVTGKLIDKARLRAVPHATLSIEAKQMMNK